MCVFRCSFVNVCTESIFCSASPPSTNLLLSIFSLSFFKFSFFCFVFSSVRNCIIDSCESCVIEFSIGLKWGNGKKVIFQRSSRVHKRKHLNSVLSMKNILFCIVISINHISISHTLNIYVFSLNVFTFTFAARWASNILLRLIMSQLNVNASCSLNFPWMRSEFLFPFSIVIAWDHSSRPNRMCLCCHKQMSIALGPDHIFWCMHPTGGLRIYAKWFARRFRLRVATQRELPGGWGIEKQNEN